MLHSICQVCGSSMYTPKSCGTNADNSLSSEYCSNCYKNGRFYNDTRDGGLDVPWVIYAGRRPGGGFGL